MVNNTDEVMVAHQTTEQYFNKILAFARDINHTVLPIKRTDMLYSQYVISSFINTAQPLLAAGITDFKMIDKFWMIAIQSKKVFAILVNIVGLNTALNSYKGTQNSIDKNCSHFKRKVTNNELGVDVGIL